MAWLVHVQGLGVMIKGDGELILRACWTWSVESDLQPTFPKSDRLLAVLHGWRT